MKAVIRTVGHSSRSWEAFLALLRAFSVEVVCDVRAWPNSRRFPQFNRSAMEEALSRAGILYQWMGKRLGGHRRRGLGESSPNLALSDGALRNYADHMQGREFQCALDDLIATAEHARVAVMCAERDYANCHRRLLSDALAARGVEVVHILGPGESTGHRLSPGARIVDGTVTYPLPDDLLTGDEKG